MTTGETELLGIGRLVRIKDGVEDKDIPVNRLGLIVKIDGKEETYSVLLTNGKQLCFNSYWLIPVETG